MFEGCSSMQKFYIPFIAKNNHYYNMMKLYDLDTSKVLYMNNIFKDCTSLKSVNIQNWNLNNVISMSGMFRNCIALRSLTLGNYNLNNVKYMDYLFYNCK